MTLSEVLNAYEDDLRVRSKTSSRRVAAVHCRTILRNMNIVDASLVSRHEVNLLIERLRRDGQRDTSINGVLRVLRAALRLAGLDSPVKLLRETKVIPDVLSEFDLKALFNASRTFQAGLALSLAANAGLRKGEIEHLTWDDVDFLQENCVRVRAKAGWSPKSHAERDVPMNEALRNCLWGNRPTAAKVTDRVIWDRDTWRQVKAAFVEAGLAGRGKPGLHMLRRTFASRLLGAGVDIETVRELGGWADLTTVQRYVASTNDLKRAAVEKL